MGSECGEESSACSESSCETSSKGRCGCGTECGGDPIECAVGMWSASFFQALKEVQVDLLKARIQKAWGAKLEKGADATLEAMGSQWQAMMAQAKAKSELRAKLQSLQQ